MERVRLNVGGTVFETTRATLRRHQGSLLAAWADDPSQWAADPSQRTPHAIVCVPVCVCVSVCLSVWACVCVSLSV
jgi:hypothetical protein